MCGLFGYKTTKGANLTEYQKRQRAAMARGLAVAMQSRGTDSTGIAGLMPDRNITIYKDIKAASQFINTRQSNQILHNASTLIGHTRLATHGAVTQPNAHPYHFGRIVGAHNGIVSNAKQIDASKQVDSMVIFDQLNKSNNNPKKTFKKLQGMFALTWLDTEQPDNLHFAAHSNPLYWFTDDQTKTLYWASTELALSTVRAAVGIGKDAMLYYPPEDQTYTADGVLGFTAIKTPFQAYQAPKYDNKHYNAADYNKNIDDWEAEYNRHYGLDMEDDDIDDGLSYIYDTVIHCQWCQGEIFPYIEGYYLNEYSDTTICTDCGKEFAHDLAYTHHPAQYTWEGKKIPA